MTNSHKEALNFNFSVTFNLLILIKQSVVTPRVSFCESKLIFINKLIYMYTYLTPAFS